MEHLWRQYSIHMYLLPPQELTYTNSLPVCSVEAQKRSKKGWLDVSNRIMHLLCNKINVQLRFRVVEINIKFGEQEDIFRATVVWAEDGEM